MKSFKYDEEKLVELDAWLKENYEYTRTKDSFEIKANGLDRKRISHFISTLNGIHKTPPLGMCYDEGAQMVSVFDQR